ncbi:MAG: TRAP transporter small permease [Bradyrhizobium sp.]|uniref:TRAP transporter small permease n=1 Tax=Bradyrhizobium sp. TaxID=376 RepID=UPI00271D47FD|nr:TRAP transporter small permease [Bradyrhizobium sp.]MDO9561945.1 TRAP transporter small permease [Bradyrhizobium sp.]MDP3689538.1 TRAP transporter small permease [Bradyrhizobium sp.]
MDSPALRGVERAIAFVAGALKWSLIAATAIMVGCIALQVVMRYVFGRTPSWTEELAVLMFSWSVMGGLAFGVREGFHVRLDALINLAPPGGRAWAERAIDALTAVFGFYLAWSGLRFLDMTGGSVSAAIGYPIEFLHALAPVAGGLIGLFASWRMLAGPPAEPLPEPAP